MSHAPSRYRIVPRQSTRRWPWAVAAAGAWLLSLGLAWHWAGTRAAPTLADTARRMHEAERQLAHLQSKRIVEHCTIWLK